MRDTRDELEGPRVPLKTILQNFLNHVENLEARKREGDDAYEKEFQVSFCNIYQQFKVPKRAEIRFLGTPSQPKNSFKAII